MAITTRSSTNVNPRDRFIVIPPEAEKAEAEKEKQKSRAEKVKKKILFLALLGEVIQPPSITFLFDVFFEKVLTRRKAELSRA
jgi:hypothetical protein